MAGCQLCSRPVNIPFLCIARCRIRIVSSWYRYKVWHLKQQVRNVMLYIYTNHKLSARTLKYSLYRFTFITYDGAKFMAIYTFAWAGYGDSIRHHNIMYKADQSTTDFMQNSDQIRTIISPQQTWHIGLAESLKSTNKFPIYIKSREGGYRSTYKGWCTFIPTLKRPLTLYMAIEKSNATHAQLHTYAYVILIWSWKSNMKCHKLRDWFEAPIISSFPELTGIPGYP